MATKKTTEITRDTVEFDITTTQRDWTPENIVTMINSGVIDMPVFQRNYVWDIKKASRLVESLILGLPIPEVFFYTAGDENDSYKVIDGQQRILSIYFYILGKFPKNTSSRLSVRENVDKPGVLLDSISKKSDFRDFKLVLDEGNPLNNKSFSELEESLQIKLKIKRYLRAVVIRQNATDVNNEAMFEVFSRFNTGGSFLTNQEIRASLYYCPFY